MTRRLLHKLTAQFCLRHSVPGSYPDGGGLYLNIGTTGAKNWSVIFRDPLRKKQREMGLGSYNDITLVMAREKMLEVRRVIGEGKDPIREREKNRHSERLDGKTFAEVAQEWLELNVSGWKGGKTTRASTWANNVGFVKAILPVLGNVAVGDIDREHVMRVLSPHWLKSPHWSHRLRTTMEGVIQQAIAFGYRKDRYNPAMLKEVKPLLPRRRKGQFKTRHFPSMPHHEVPGFIERLNAFQQERQTRHGYRHNISGWALEFQILTAVRPGAAVAARWDQIDLANALWRIPAEQMKGGTPFTVPLSTAVLAFLERLPRKRGLQELFPPVRGSRFTHCAPLQLRLPLSALGYLNPDKVNSLAVTPHGFRTSFKTWAREVMRYDQDVVEVCLGHISEDAVGRAYFHKLEEGTAFLDDRRRIMEMWGVYCTNPEEVGNIVPLKRTVNA